MSKPAALHSTKLPSTRALNDPPPPWGGHGSRSAPLYGLGWRSSHAKVLAKYRTNMDIALVPLEILALEWHSQEAGERFQDKIIFDPRFIPDFKLLNAGIAENAMLCFITFNIDANHMANLSSAEGIEFMKAAKDVMKITAEDEKSLMWYRCSLRYSP
ncbi:hypothetical protein DFH06DRAFT_1228452 [Mycena polygramma]|nr:hypothetical protein DFH06DRAFT_1228452 [Mycena polygramma]